jgi:RNA polymerase sigma factor (sigma-70 family)
MTSNLVNGVDLAEHIGLAHAAVKPWRSTLGHGGISYDDLLSAALGGLAVAARKYQPGKAKFSSYGYRGATNAIRRYVQNNGSTVRTPVHAQGARGRARCVSLDAPSGDEFAGSLHDILSDGHVTAEAPELEQWQERKQLTEAIAQLPAFEIGVVEHRFLRGLQRKQVASLLGIGRLRCEVLEVAALAKLQWLLGVPLREVLSGIEVHRPEVSAPAWWTVEAFVFSRL